MSAIGPIAVYTAVDASHTAAMPLRSEAWLLTLLSVIAGMVDLIGFVSLSIFTAHVTGNIVAIGALIVRHNRGESRTDPGDPGFYRSCRCHLADCQSIGQARYGL